MTASKSEPWTIYVKLHYYNKYGVQIKPPRNCPRVVKRRIIKQPSKVTIDDIDEIVHKVVLKWDAYLKGEFDISHTYLDSHLDKEVTVH